ncbi:MAG: HEPN domain-containing protein [Candidatus Accumulibacter phosphatis]|nr:HEPN domain-containing protein [Candidatus Accumulibacter phosphatis]
MALNNPPPHLQELLDNLSESISLLHIHGQVVGQGPGRKYGVEVLNKSALVLIVACWEAYVEDTVTAALTFMIDNCKDHTIFPKNVLERVGSTKQGLKSWDLAGDGWKAALKDNLTGVLAKTTGTLNTPRAPQVDELFHKVIGLTNLSSTWKWNNVRSQQVVDRLDSLITTRGSIAHRVKHSAPVYKKTVREAADLIGRLSARVNNETRKHVHGLVDKYPWYAIRFKGTN